jgi:hypothetical protein
MSAFVGQAFTPLSDGNRGGNSVVSLARDAKKWIPVFRANPAQESSEHVLTGKVGLLFRNML